MNSLEEIDMKLAELKGRLAEAQASEADIRRLALAVADMQTSSAGRVDLLKSDISVVEDLRRNLVRDSAG